MSAEAPTIEERLARVERRLEREHRTRLEAERIAEETTAELYESQRELELIGEVSHRSNLAGDFGEAVRVTLETVCAHTRWEAGHAYLLDPERGDLRPSGIWHVNAASGFDALVEKTMDTRFEIGKGLPGRVAAAAAPVCIPDVKGDPSFTRAVDTDLEIRGALGFPALVDDRVFAVLEFFSVAVMHEHDRITAMLSTVGSQLGPVLERILVREEVERYNRQLEEANEELKEFAYVASHDLSEPLRTISGFVQLLQSRYEGRLDSDADEFIGYVVQGTSRMQRLIEDLLVYSRVGRAELRVGAVELEEVLERVRRAYGTAISEADAELVVVGTLPTVEGDPAELERLLSNLISNAIKFRGVREPRVTVSAARRADGRIEVLVADNGIGIEARHAERIFRVFQRLHSIAEYPGTGIGLSICKKIVERHGGSISAAPGPEGGSVMRFDLPAAGQENEDGEGMD